MVLTYGLEQPTHKFKTKHIQCFKEIFKKENLYVYVFVFLGIFDILLDSTQPFCTAIFLLLFQNQIKICELNDPEMPSTL